MFYDRKHVVIIRSSIYPGLLKRVEKILYNKNHNIVYCPERIVQGYAIKELSKLPQIVSGFSEEAKKSAGKLFNY